MYYWAGAVIFYLLLESVLPLKLRSASPVPRWTANVSLFLLNGVLTYFFLYNFMGVDLEVASSQIQSGLFQLIEGVPFWAQLITFVVVSDFTFYWFHRAMHTWRPLWRLHIVHHSDRDVDMTVSFRAHPFQLIVETAIRIGLVILLGVPLLALIILDVFYAFFVFYPHAKVRIPRGIERVLRTVVVTSDMHRLHHSNEQSLTNSNYGDIFSFWDKMFGTYQFMEWEEQEKLTLGLEYFNTDEDQSIFKVLMQPFTYKPLHPGEKPKEIID
jgi:sterol desaturase/sphingolipid hydroxylase (fatty acid hydroxylase superfamily)